MNFGLDYLMGFILLFSLAIALIPSSKFQVSLLFFVSIAGSAHIALNLHPMLGIMFFLVSVFTSFQLLYFSRMASREKNKINRGKQVFFGIMIFLVWVWAIIDAPFNKPSGLLEQENEKLVASGAGVTSHLEAIVVLLVLLAAVFIITSKVSRKGRRSRGDLK